MFLEHIFLYLLDFSTIFIKLYVNFTLFHFLICLTSHLIFLMSGSGSEALERNIRETFCVDLSISANDERITVHFFKIPGYHL